MSEEKQSQSQDSVGYWPHQNMSNSQESLLSKHLDAKEILMRLKMMLLNREYDEDADKWVQLTEEINSNGQILTMSLPPLMEPQEVNMTIGFLESFLNPNTFLSTLQIEEINEIMWQVNKALAKMFYSLRYKLTPHARDLLWIQIDNAIFIALKRATNKITLDAMSKMQQSVEHIESNPKETNQKDEFKVLGW